MDKHSAKKWIISFFAVVLAIMLLLSGIVFVIDPFFQYRVKDNAYMLSGWFVSSGLIKNHDYDTLLLGSSLTQNFNMDKFREEMGVEPLHISLGGMEPVEIKEFIEIAYEAQKADTYYIGVDTYAFNTEAEESRYPKYLIKEDFLSRCRYFFSYEVWFRYIPVDMAFMLLDAIGIEMPIKFEYSKSVDRLEDWSLNGSYGEDVVLAGFSKGVYDLSEFDAEAVYNQMISGIDKYMEYFDYDKGEHVFFFPPYSSLYWCDTEDCGYMEPYLRAKEYFVKQANARGAKVFDFQAADFTKDLDNYMDFSHYRPEINDWMVECFARNECLVNENNFAQYQEKLLENTRVFREEHAYIFN